MIKQITFSPTGGTKKVAEAISTAISNEVECIELSSPASELVTTTLSQEYLAIVAAPVYGGRIPAIAIERLKSLVKANGAKCAVVAVYGNRAYDDALLELYKTCTEMGFNVIAAVGAVAEHSIIREYGANRPDADDLKELKAFGGKIKDSADAGKTLAETALMGNFPYKKAGSGPYPKASKKCTDCGLCAKQCPVGAITGVVGKEPFVIDQSKCIKCGLCESSCRFKAIEKK